MLLPCVVFAFLGAWAVDAGRRLLDSWQSASVRVPVPVVSVDLTMNFIDLLQVRPLYEFVSYWDDRLWLTFALLWLIPWALWIVAGALFAILLAAIYNTIGRLGGGIRVTMTPASNQPPGPPPAPAGWAPGPPAGPAAGWSHEGWPQERRQ